MRRLICSSLLSFVLLANTSEVLANPFQFSYGGRLTEADGKPVEGPIDVEVSFFSAETGGVPLGAGIQSFSAVPLVQGVFKIDLSLSGADFHSIFPDFTAPVWVEVTDTTHKKIYPRQKFTTVPFASVIPVDDKTVAFDSAGRLTVLPTGTPAPGQFLTQDSSGYFVWAYPPSAGTSIHGKSVKATTPAAGHVLQFDGTDWTSVPLANGNVTSVSVSSPFVVTDPTTTPNISIPAATSVSSGYMSSTDWNIFNGKQDVLGYLPYNKAGDSMSGPLQMNGNKITGVATPTLGTDAANKSYVDSAAANYVRRNGSDQLTGDWSAADHDITGIATLKSTSVSTRGQAAFQINPWGSSVGQTGEFRFTELFVVSGQYVGFKAPDSIPSNVVWTLPASDGAPSSILRTDGAGQLSWVSAAAAAGAVSSVAGRNGTVVLDTDDVPEGTNLYHDDALARASVVGDSIADGVSSIAPSQNAVFDALSGKLNKTGGSLSGPLNMGAQSLSQTSSIAASSLNTSGQSAVALNPFGTSSGNTGEFRFKDLGATNYVGFKAPDNINADITWILPAADGTTNQVLRTNGTGQLSWTSVSSLTVADSLADGVSTIAPSQNSVFDALALKLDKTGGTLSGPLNMSAQKITGLDTPTAASDATNKTYADGIVGPYLKRDGSTPLTAAWNLGGFNVSGVGSFSAGASSVASVSTTSQAALSLTPFGAGAGQTGELRLQDLTGTQYSGFKAPDTIAVSQIWTLPPADGTSNQILKTDGAGRLSWVDASTLTVADSIADSITTSAPSQNAVFDALALKLDLSGGTLSGPLNMSSQAIGNLAPPTLNGDGATRDYVDSVIVPFVRKDGTSALTGNWAVGGFNITGVGSFSAGPSTVTSLTTSSQNALVLAPYGASPTNTSEMRLKELTANGNNWIGFKAPDLVGANQIFTLPASDGAANDLLTTNGLGRLSWSSASSLTVADSITNGVTSIAPSQNAVFDALALEFDKSGGTLSGALNLGTHKITNLAAPTQGTDAVTKSYADALTGPYLHQNGSTALSGSWNVGGFAITGVGTFTAGASALSTLTTTSQEAMSLDPYGVAAGNTAESRFQELAAQGSNFVGFKAPDSIPSNQIWTLPASDGSANFVLKTDGAGQLSFVSASSLSVQDSITDAVVDFAPSQNAVFDAVALTLSHSGGTLSGPLAMSAQKVINLAAPTAATDAATKAYADGVIAPYLRKDGSTPLTAPWAVGGFNITGVGAFGANSLAASTITTSAQAALTIAPYNTGAGQTGELRFKRLSGSEYVGFKSPDTLAGDRIWTLPAADGSANHVLRTNGSGILSWVSASSSSVQDSISDGVSTIAPSQNAVFDALALTLPLSGGTLSGALDMGTTNKIVNLAAPTLASDAANKAYVDTAVGSYLKQDGSVPLTGNWAAGAFAISNVTDAAASSVATGTVTTSAIDALTLKPYGSTAGNTGELRFNDLTNTRYVGFKAPDSLLANRIWVLPNAVGAANQVLKTDGSLNLGWLTPSTLTVADAISDGVTAVAPSQNAVFDALALKLDKTGGTMSGVLNMGTSNKITGLATPTLATDAATKAYADGLGASYLAKNGSSPLTAAWAVGGFNISNVGSFSAAATTAASLTTTSQAAATLLPYGAGAGQTSELRFKELSASGSEYVGFKAPDTIATSRTFVLPSSDGTANQILKGNGAGTFSWTTPSSLIVTQSITSGVTTTAPSQDAVFSALTPLITKTGDTMSGALAMGNTKITGLATPTVGTDASTKAYADTVATLYVKRDGSTPLTGNWAVGGFNISGVGTLGAGATSVSSLNSSGAVSGTALSSSTQAAFTAAPFGTTAGQTGEIRFKNLPGTNYIGFRAPDAITTNRIWTLPAADGTANQVLKTDASGNLGWVTPASLAISQTIGSGVTDFAPSGAAVFTALAAKVDKAGDTMTGALTLPTNGLTVGTSQLVAANGYIGIGVSPTLPLSFPSTLGDKISLFGNIGQYAGFGIQTGQFQFLTPVGGKIGFGWGSSTSLVNTVTFESNGKVGIGLWSPATRLHVASTTATNTEGNILTLDSNNSSVGAGPALDFKNNGAGYLAGIAAIQEGTSDARLEFRTSGDSALTASRLTAADTRMTIDRLGKIGIGTTAPAAKLHVQRTVAAATDGTMMILDSNNGTTNSGSSFQFKNANGSSGYLAAIAGLDDTNFDGRLEFRVSNDNAATTSPLTSSDTKMVITRQGKIGVGGLQNPAYPLSFPAVLGNKISFFGTSGAHYGLGIQNNSLQIYTDTALAAVTFGYGSSATMGETARIQGDGNMGIGITDPDSKLHLSGGLQTDSGFGGIGFGTCPHAACTWPYETMQLSAGKNFRIQFGTTERFVLNSGGAAQKGGTMSWENLSDIRTKDVQGAYSVGLDEILELSPIVYSYREDNPYGYNSKAHYVGFSAQDVQKQIPRAIKTNEKGFLSLTADPIIWAMVNGLKEEHAQRLDDNRLVDDELARAEAELLQLKAELKAKDQEIHQIESTLETLANDLCRRGPKKSCEP